MLKTITKFKWQSYLKPILQNDAHYEKEYQSRSHLYTPKTHLMPRTRKKTVYTKSMRILHVKKPLTLWKKQKDNVRMNAQKRRSVPANLRQRRKTNKIAPSLMMIPAMTSKTLRGDQKAMRKHLCPHAHNNITELQISPSWSTTINKYVNNLKIKITNVTKRRTNLQLVIVITVPRITRPRTVAVSR